MYIHGSRELEILVHHLVAQQTSNSYYKKYVRIL